MMNKLGIAVVCAAVGIGASIRAVAETPTLKRGEEITFAMRDGTLFRGKIDVKTFEVDTLYGKLAVPATDVIRIRIGKNSNRDLKDRIDKLVADLANKDFRIREEAQKELAKLGKMAYAELDAASHSTDSEVRERASTLLADITLEEEEELQPADDEVVTPAFVIRGTIKLDALSVVTKFGTLRVDKKDLLTLTLAEPEFAVKAMTLSGRNTTQSQWLDTGIRVKKGDHLILSASGSINWINFGQSSEPGGNSNWGTWRTLGSQPIYNGALVGKIGAGGAFFFVGEKYNEKASGDGMLFLAIAANWGGQQMPSSGEYKVKIEVRPGQASREGDKLKPGVEPGPATVPVPRPKP